MVIHKATAALEKLSSGRTRQWLANKSLGTASTALLENYFEKGGYVPPHYHDSEELLVCLEGEGKIILDQEEHPFPAGGTAIIPALAVHEVHNVGEGPMRMMGFFPVAAPSVTWIGEEKD